MLRRLLLLALVAGAGVSHAQWVRVLEDVGQAPIYEQPPANCYTLDDETELFLFIFEGIWDTQTQGDLPGFIEYLDAGTQQRCAFTAGHMGYLIGTFHRPNIPGTLNAWADGFNIPVTGSYVAQLEVNQNSYNSGSGQYGSFTVRCEVFGANRRTVTPAENGSEVLTVEATCAPFFAFATPVARIDHALSGTPYNFLRKSWELQIDTKLQAGESYECADWVAPGMVCYDVGDTLGGGGDSGGGGIDWEETPTDEGCRILDLFCWARWAFQPNEDWGAEFSSLSTVANDRIPFGFLSWWPNVTDGDSGMAVGESTFCWWGIQPFDLGFMGTEDVNGQTGGYIEIVGQRVMLADLPCPFDNAIGEFWHERVRGWLWGIFLVFFVIGLLQRVVS